MSHPAPEARKQYCYREYAKLPSDKRYEIIEGILYAMVPSPSTQHQRVLGNLFFSIKSYLANNSCEVFCAPYDVLLPEKGEDADNVKTVVQPDILVVCDKAKLTEKHCTGAPDFIIEIVSPSSPSMDYVKKLHLYEKHKVREYWIVNYTRKEIMAYRLLENGEYGEPEIYSGKEIVAGIFEGLKIPLDVIFE